MRRILLIGAVTVCVLTCPFASAYASDAETHLIPLDQVWGYDIPGTRDVRELEPKATIQATPEELAGRLPDDVAFGYVSSTFYAPAV